MLKEMVEWENRGSHYVKLINKELPAVHDMQLKMPNMMHKAETFFSFSTSSYSEINYSPLFTHGRSQCVS